MPTLRRWMDARPMMTFSLCFLLGAAVGCQNVVDWRIWCSLSALLFLILCLRRRRVYLFCTALFLGALLTTLALIRPTVAEQEGIRLSGLISDAPYVTDEYLRVQLSHTESDGESIGCDVMLYIYPDEDDKLPVSLLEYGMTICIDANTHLPDDTCNPFGYSYSKYLWRSGIALTATASADSLTVLAEAQPSAASFLARCRFYIEAAIFDLCDEQTAPVVCALVLGDRRLMPDELYDRFRTTGLAHLLAISGLHISCLAAALDFLLRKLRCPRLIVFIFITLFLLFYAALIGFPASISRALIMYVLSASARLCARRADGFTSLSIAALILLLINPLYIADYSFILSFSSVAGILGLADFFIPRSIFRIRNFLFKPLFWIVSALSASLAAQITSLPAVACLFSELPVYSLLANLPALPLITFTLPFILLSVITSFIFLPAAHFIAAGANMALRLLFALTHQISALPFSIVSSPIWSVPIILLYALVCISCFSVSSARQRTKRRLILLLPVLTVCALLRPLTYPKDDLEILFLDAGQADAAVIRAEDRYYLMDVGENDVCANYLRASGIRPSAIFISHAHSDHAAGLKELLTFCPPAVIYLPVQWNELLADEGVPELIEQARIMGWEIRTLSAGDIIPLSGSVCAEVHQPRKYISDDPNGISLVVEIRFHESSVLFTGDLPTKDEYAFFPDCDILKIAHHGSKHSTSELFLKMTSPSAAVISVGRNNYGHPADALLERLESIGCTTYRTDQNGAVRILLDADGGILATPSKSNPSPNHESEAAS